MNDPTTRPLYRMPTTHERGIVEEVISNLDDAKAGWQMSSTARKLGLAAASIAEILKTDPMPFPKESEQNNIRNRDSLAGRAIRSACANVFQANMLGVSSVGEIAGHIVADMNAQCEANRLVYGAFHKDYRATLDPKERQIAEFLSSCPQEREAMTHQARGEFYKMPADMQVQVNSDIRAGERQFVDSPRNKTRLLEKLPNLSVTTDEPCFSIIARAASLNRLNHMGQIIGEKREHDTHHHTMGAVAYARQQMSAMR